MAGKKWSCSFMKRRPIFSLRVPECIEVARVKHFNKENFLVSLISSETG
jgi:hypothetical protein